MDCCCLRQSENESMIKGDVSGDLTTHHGALLTPNKFLLFCVNHIIPCWFFI